MKSDTILKKYTFWHDIDNEFSKNIDFSKTPISEVAEKAHQSEYTNSDDNKNLHEYIFQFYAYNELLSSYREKHNGIIDNEDLKIYEQYQDFNNDFSKRIFSFILYACFAEARHSYYISNDQGGRNGYDDDYLSDLNSAFCEHTWNAEEKNYIYNNFVEDIYKNWDAEEIKSFEDNKDNFKSTFHDFVWENYSIPDDLPSDFVDKFHNTYNSEEKNLNECIGYFSTYYCDEIKNVSRFTEFVKCLQEVQQVGRDGDGGSLQRALVREDILGISNISHFPTEEIFHYLSIFFLYNFEGGYGGAPWSDIAKHALSFCKGEMNGEMFIDRALSLEHNNGKMFNKNFIFDDEVSNGSMFILLDQNNTVQTNLKSLKLTDFILHLQNSSSVLSIAQFLDTDFPSLTKELDLATMKTFHKDFNVEHVNSFHSNFDTFQDFSQNIVSLKPMLEIAKKINYSIPKFDFANMCLVVAQKINPYNGYSHNILLDSLEKNSSYNAVFSDIVNGKYQIPVAIENNNSVYIENPVFNLHNLNNLSSKSLTKDLIGGKAKGLVELINKGFNVPKALVFDTHTCMSYLSNSKYFHKSYQRINKQISDYLVDNNNKPLLVSVRSGAPVSMPGMMDSILNVGIDDSTYPQLCKIHTKKVINDCVMSFIHQFCASKLNLDIQFPENLHKALDKFAETLIKNDIDCDRRNLFPLSKESQVKLCVEAVFDSWNSPRAIAWRNEKNIAHDIGTAATVQQMVFGNRNDNSLTSVIFSRDCITGKPEIMGEYLIKAQGEDLVSGKRTPLPISNLQTINPKIYKEIEYIAKVLEEDKKAIQDLEITVENGKVYVLQMRNAVVSPEAQISLAKELDLNLLDIIQPENLIGDIIVDTIEEPIFNGLAASPGLISGIIVKNQFDIEQYKNSEKPLIFFSNQALPDHAPIMIATDAFITEFGGSTSHAAILARSMGKPCVVGIGKQEIESGTTITMDAMNGKIWLGELAISINQDKAIALSHKILKEEKIILEEDCLTSQFNIQSWVSGLSKLNILENNKDNKHVMFLNLAQKTALALKMENTKKNRVI